MRPYVARISGPKVDESWTLGEYFERGNAIGIPLRRLVITAMQERNHERGLLEQERKAGTQRYVSYCIHRSDSLLVPH